MDFSTVIGFVLGAACLFFGGAYTLGDPGAFADANALLIVVGAVASATLVMFPLRTALGVFKTAMQAFKPERWKASELVEQLVELSRLARTDGILALEEAEKELGNSFLKKGIQLAVDGNEEALIRFILATDVEATRERHATGKKLFTSMGMMAPAFGLAGTLMGLVNFFSAPGVAVGPTMAAALLPLLYGVVLASLLFFPLASKLAFRSRQEALAKEVIIEGIISIMQGVNPRVLRDRLEAFVAPDMRSGQPFSGQ